jgi:hypothetical protein
MINNLYDDILIYISSYLDDKENLNLIQTCKYFKNLFNKVGFLKFLKCEGDKHQSIYNFMITYFKHIRTVDYIYISHIDTPQYWINNKWCKIVHLYNCYLEDKIDPLNICNTEQLIIQNIYPSKWKNKLKINWNKFPNLRILQLDIQNIDLVNIEICQNLELIYININEKTEFSSSIGTLKKLKHLITNCIIDNRTYFKSKDLLTCITKNSIDNNFIFDSKHQIMDKNNFYNIGLLYQNLKELKKI